MPSYKTYLWVGVWLFLLPFLGIPGSFKDALVILTALFFVAYGLLLMRQSLPKEKTDAPSDASERTTTDRIPRV